MPIPKPRPDEQSKEFMERCMADTVMQEYKISQRYMICLDQYENKRQQ